MKRKTPPMRTSPEEQKNIRDFFDGLFRDKQKARLTGEYPKENDLIRLAIYKDICKVFYGDAKFKSDMLAKKINLVDNNIDRIIKEKLEYSISIGGAGREEFIKMKTRPKEEDEDEDEEGKKDFLGKIADMV
jgi:ribosome-binding protein aMBF1 (putative translation factor)